MEIRSITLKEANSYDFLERRRRKHMIQKVRTGDRAEWLALRGRYIGGSDAGAVVGLNPYQSAYGLWAEKTGRVPPFEGNIATEVGSYLEQLVAEMFERETGKKVRRSNVTYINDKYPWACADVDRLIVGEASLLEIKTTNSIPAMRKLRGGEFPEQWWAQVCHYMAVLDLQKAYLAVLINCRELKIFELDRDDDEIAALMTAEAAFWRHVEDDTPPPVDGSPATSDALKAIYADSVPDTCELFGRTGILGEYMELKAQSKALDARIAEIENVIKGDMESAERGTCGAYTVTWRTQERRTLDAKRLAADVPQLDLTPYYKCSKSRVFKITKESE